MSMRMNSRQFGVVLLAGLSGCGFTSNQPPTDSTPESWVAKWNGVAVDMSGVDHTPVEPDDDRVFGEQLGPTRSSRAMAIVHIAIFEAVNAVDGRYESYTGLPRTSADTNLRAAVAQAAHDTLTALFPSQQPVLTDKLERDLADIPAGPSRENGIALGRDAAASILAMRENDGSDVEDDHVFSDAPGFWRVDPLNPDQEPHGAQWYHVEPFVMESANQFRPPPPPPITSTEYADAYAEVYDLGGDGIITPTSRTEEQTLIGIYWAYDGTPSLCAPPRMYNQITMQFAHEQGLDVAETARLLALVNVALADTGIAVWEAKYHYDYWRPVAGIREADPGTGPTGLGDGNPDTSGDPTFTPLGAPASNLGGENFTPPFPAYPSGHAGFGGALFETLRNVFGRDDMPFTFVSDELNGVTVDKDGDVRPLVARSFESLSQAEEENGQSRIYLGIHWSFDKTEGIATGRQVADHVFDNLFRPVTPTE